MIVNILKLFYYVVIFMNILFDDIVGYEEVVNRMVEFVE